MPQWLKGHTSAIWVLHRWPSHPKIISDSDLDFSEVGERIALVRGDALQLPSAEPTHADDASRLALAARHCLQCSDEWACRVRHARTVVKQLAALAPEPEALYWQILAQTD